MKTILLRCLIPTIGSHVFSRTGHTALKEAFWFHHHAILHSSGHLKYQDLAVHHAFMRSIITTVVAEDLFSKQPGRSVMKLFSFTGTGSVGRDSRGWTYVHLDEALEMLIVRYLKGLSVNLLQHLENSTAWLIPVSPCRSLCRYVTGASRSIGSKRANTDGGEGTGPLNEYDLNACQWKTVARMLHLMRECGFLNLEHRGSEWFTNVFAVPKRRMTLANDRKRLLDIWKLGRDTAKLHASVFLPELFGSLTDEDRSTYFDGAIFKKWNKRRRVLTPAQSMAKNNSFALIEGEAEILNSSMLLRTPVRTMDRPKDKAGFVKVVTERRRIISKFKDALYLEERKEIQAGNKQAIDKVLFVV